MSHAFRQDSYQRHPSPSRNPVPSVSDYDSGEEILSNFRDWIPVPWIKLIKEAGFRRKTPPIRQTEQNTIGKNEQQRSRYPPPATPSYPTSNSYDIPSSTRPSIAQRLTTRNNHPKTVEFSYRNEHEPRYQPRIIGKQQQRIPNPNTFYQQNQFCSCDALSRKSDEDIQSTVDKYEEPNDEEQVSEEQQESGFIFEEYTDNEIESMCRKYFDDRNKKKSMPRMNQRSRNNQSLKLNFEQTYLSASTPKRQVSRSRQNILKHD
jgi:hypothetical protein